MGGSWTILAYSPISSLIKASKRFLYHSLNIKKNSFILSFLFLGKCRFLMKLQRPEKYNFLPERLWCIQNTTDGRSSIFRFIIDIFHCDSLCFPLFQPVRLFLIARHWRWSTCRRSCFWYPLSIPRFWRRCRGHVRIMGNSRSTRSRLPQTRSGR